MRKLRITFLFIIIVIIGISVLNMMRENASAYPPGWSDDIRLTIADDTSSQPTAILDSNDIMYLIWADERDGNYEIYLKNSTDKGVSWNSDLRLTNDPYVSNFPKIAIDSFNALHIVWREQRSSIVYLNYMNSTDGGSTWSSIQQLYSASGDATAVQGYILGYPQIAIGKDDVVHVVFSDDPAPSATTNGHTTYVRYLNSTDLGITWNTVVTLGTGQDIARWCSLAADKSGNVYVAWHDWTMDYFDALIDFVRSNNNGGSWSSQTKLINVNGDSNLPHVAAKDPDIVYLVFRDSRLGNYEIYYKISVNAGASWGPDTRLTFDSAVSGYPTICPDSGDNASIVWMDFRDPSSEIYYAEINVIGDVLVSDTRLTDDPNTSNTPFIIFDSFDRPHIFWSDDRAGNYEIYYKRLAILITDVTAIPNPQEVYGYVNISAVQISNVTIFGTWVEIFDPDGGLVGNFSMVYDPINDRYYLNQSYGVVGTYSFTIYANDTTNYWSSASDTFVIQDTTPPTITEVLTFPNPQEVFENVNITANCTDNYQLFGVWVEIYDPDEGFVGNFSMLYDPINDRHYWNQDYDVLGTYSLTIWANDTSDNWMSVSETFIIQDTTPPVITDILPIPDPQEVFQNVNITANCTDNYQLFWAWIEIQDPNGGLVGNFSLPYDPINDRYYWNQSYDMVGTYTFTIWTNDTSDNWDTVSDSFVIQDTIPPTVTDAIAVPNPQEVFKNVNITANCSDNYQLFGAWVEIYDPGAGLVGNISMLYDPINDRYYWNQNYDILGAYSFTIWTNDTSDNWNTVSDSFVIQDTTLPEISNVQEVPDSPIEVNWANISCDATDNVEVYNVWVNITLPSGGYSNVSMIQGAGDQWYLNSTYAALGLYQYTIWVNDTSDNWNLSSGHIFIIQDITAPEIFNVIDAPDPQETGKNVNISCNATDVFGVYNVWVNITAPDGAYSNISMTQGAGDGWFYNDTYVPLGLYQYTIWANDTNDNWATASGEFLIRDTTPPGIDDITADPDPQIVSEDVMITAHVTDNYQIYGVWINITDPDGYFLGNYLMAYNPANARYFLNREYDAPDPYSFTIWANDTSDNWASVSDGFTIQETVPPLISDVEAVPDPQEVFENVNISAQVTDNHQLAGVWVEIYDPDGNFVGNISMLSRPINDEYYWYQSYNTVGTYFFTIWACDASNNWAYEAGTFLVQDTTPPAITNVIASPDPQEVYGYTNIVANVVDNYQLYGAWIEIYDPDGALLGNFSLMYDPFNSRYFWNQNYDVIGTYSFTIWANDTSDNWAYEIDTFLIQDNTEPMISSAIALPNPQEVYGFVNVSANVIDNYELSDVWLEIFDPAGNLMGNYSMLFHSIDGKYYLSQIYNTIGTYSFTMFANDTSGNLATASNTFVVQDTTPPVLTDIVISPSPQKVSKNVNITVNASDNYLLFGVWLGIYQPNGSFIGNYSMLYDPASERFYLEQAYDLPGTYDFTIWANDTSDNWAKEDGIFIISPPPKKEEYNWKPFIALIFAIILLIVGISASYLRPLRLWGPLQKDRLYTFLLGTLPFVCVELATGVVSLFTGLLRVPPIIGIGMVVDLIILITGILTSCIIFIKGEGEVAKRAEAQPSTPPVQPISPSPAFQPPWPPSPPPPPLTPPPPPPLEEPPPPPEQIYPCSTCKQPLRYIDQYRKWYCDTCGKYI